MINDQRQALGRIDCGEESIAPDVGESLSEVLFEYGIYAGERYFVCNPGPNLLADEEMITFKHALAVVRAYGDEAVPRIGLVRPAGGRGWIGINLSIDRLRVIQLVQLEGSESELDALVALTLLLFQTQSMRAQ